MRVIPGYLLLIATLFAGVSTTPAAGPGDGSASHQKAVELARAGRYAESLQLLAALRDAAPDDRQLLYDETVVYAWAGRDERALENAQSMVPEAAPDYVLAAVAKAWRNTGNFDAAIRWYSILLARDVLNEDARSGLAMSHADRGDAQRAREIIDGAPAAQRSSEALLLAGAYLHQRQGRVMDALAGYQAVLDANPYSRAALRGKVLVLRMALLPRQALALARKHPGLLDDAEIARLEADAAALQIRHGAESAYPVQRRFEGTDRALSQLETLLTRSDLEPGVRLRLRYDRIVALVDRLRMADAVAEFEALDVDPEDVPGYVLATVGRALLYERRPEQARQYLEIAVAREPDNADFRFRLFFAYVDLQEHRRARELAEDLLARLSATNRVPGSPVVKGSEAYLRAAILRGLALAYADQLSASQKYLEGLLARLPHNTDIRGELANVYRWRGWLDRSRSQYAQVLAVEPELLSARVGNAHTRLDKRQYVRVEQELKALKKHYEREAAVRNLNERWRTHNRQQLTVEASAGESSGATFGQESYRVDARWFSRPVNHRYRILLQTHDAFAEFPEGSVHRRRAGIGLEYRYASLLATAIATGERSGGGVGVRGALDHRINDHFSWGGVLETRSNATPLRGERVGVSGNRAGLHAEYARHESAAVRAGASYQDLSDGNRMRSAYLMGEQRLVNGSAFKMTLLGELFAERRDRDDVAYFSPRESASWTAGIRNDWLMYRRYDLALTHQLTGKLGRYDQSGFATADIWTVAYRFRAAFSKGWSAHVGFSRHGNVYDGAPEYSDAVLVGFSGRF